jgi:Leucine-rich repeat (LRR) protein
MKVPIAGKDQSVDRYYPVIKNLDEQQAFQEYDDSVLNTNNVFISTLAMDFPPKVLSQKRRAIDEQWKAKFPELNHIKGLDLRHRVNQAYFEAVCEMKNLESLTIWVSNVLDISSISKLKKLKSLSISRFSQLEDIAPLVDLKSLEHLSIQASFKISNYELIEKINGLKSLEIEGDAFAPKNVMLNSLEPFAELNDIVYLNLSSASIRDKNYRPLLNLKNLKRLDAGWRMKKEEREFIQNNHPTLRSGFFMAYDFEKNRFKEGIEWWIDQE